MSKYYRLTAFLAAGLLILVAIGVYGYSKYTNKTNNSIVSHSSPRTWIITNHALNQITVNSKAIAAISNDTIYSPGYNPKNATALERTLHIIPTKTYQSEAKLASDMNSNKIPSYVKAILYDNEPWSLTPSSEKIDPVTYYQQAYNLSHSHNYTFIAAPVPNSLDPEIAKYADIVDVQAQYAQSSTPTYLSAVSTVIKQAVTANPKAIIMSGISTNPSNGDPTPEQLLDIAHATYSGLVKGWWLNIPGQGTACPKCQLPQPETAINFLIMLGPA
jgi:hypothetical protein